MASEMVVSVDAVVGFFVDENYEFSAPKFFNLLNDESEEEIRESELWFENGKSDDPSPFMMRIKGARFAETDSVCCDFGDGEKVTTKMDLETLQDTSHPPPHKQTNFPAKQTIEDAPTVTEASASVAKTPCLDDKGMLPQRPCLNNPPSARRPQVVLGTEGFTPNVPLGSVKVQAVKSSGVTKKPYTPKPRKYHLPPKTVCRSGVAAAKKSTLKTDISQENQAVKKQKLDGGGTRQIHNVKTSVLHHKSKPHSTNMMEAIASATEDTTPFLSVAELIKKFESKTREIDLPQNHSISHENSIQLKKLRPKLLTLTRPKDPNFETSHRVRAVRIKSSAELEQEMLAKIPKFKAKPVNKKILEAPAMAPSRSIPQAPQFQEFHLKTTERANQHVETASLASSIDSSCKNHTKTAKLTETKPPVLFTSLRARPPRIKSSWEMELEELAKVPKFKAKPLNKRIFERKGDATLLSNPKGQLTTIPQEFHFATNERLGLPPSASMVDDLFDKLSIQSERSYRVTPTLTLSNPFNLHTEERGLHKEKRLQQQLRWKQIQEEKKMIPKSNPYPYTTDYPVMPPKPEPKPCTKPEVFQLESLIRHEEVLQRKIEEKERLEREEAERRRFRAQPVMKEDPNPLPEKERKPLTEIQEFVLRVDHRAEDRAEFDKKMKEREMLYKREREEYEHANMVEEEKSLKRMRKKMVPHARPVPCFVNPFVPQKVAWEPPTNPKSSKLLVDERGKRYLR